MIPTPAHPVQFLETPNGGRNEARSPLAQLLHALNQPLTGLQCAMEVALASPRTLEQYVQGLREGLGLTERMRALVEAIREVTDVEVETKTERETTELRSLLRETVEDLEPVAETKAVSLTLDGVSVAALSSSSSVSLLVKAERVRLATLMFRLLDSTLSLAAWGTALQIETGSAANPDWPNQARIRVRWRASGSSSVFSRAELGLLVAQAGLEQMGAHWERERTEDLETINIGLTSGRTE